MGYLLTALTMRVGITSEQMAELAHTDPEVSIAFVAATEGDDDN